MRHYSPEVKLQYKEVKKVDVNDHISAFNTTAMFNWSNSWVHGSSCVGHNVRALVESVGTYSQSRSCMICEVLIYFIVSYL